MKVILLMVILGVLAVGGFLVFSSSNPKTEPIALPTSTVAISEAADIKVSFAIFTNGTFRAFSASMYHNRSADVFIDSSNPNIVNVKKTNIAWNDFFSTLPFKLTKECLTTGSRETFCTDSAKSLKFYLNGQLDTDALDRTIKEGDKLLVSFGAKNDPAVENQIKQIPASRPLP